MRRRRTSGSLGRTSGSGSSFSHQEEERTAIPTSRWDGRRLVDAIHEITFWRLASMEEKVFPPPLELFESMSRLRLSLEDEDGTTGVNG